VLPFECSTLVRERGPNFSKQLWLLGRIIALSERHCRQPIEIEQAFLLRHGIDGYPILKVRGRATPAAMEVRSRLESRTGPFLVHFDIDVIDFVDFPAADVLQPNQGLTFPDALAALQTFCASPKFGGLIVTEFNPDHDDNDGTLAKQLIEGLAQALQS
jgi:arginase family enzyme